VNGGRCLWFHCNRPDHSDLNRHQLTGAQARITEVRPGAKKFSRAVRLTSNLLIARALVAWAVAGEEFINVRANDAMSYITHSLGRNETLRYRAHFHWFYYFATWGAFLISLVAAAEAHGCGLPWVAGLAPLLGVAAFLSIMIPIWTTEIGVTNQRFIFKRGLLRRTTNELQLRAVEQVNLRQGIPGRLFNFGHLEVHGTGRHRVAGHCGSRCAAKGHPGLRRDSTTTKTVATNAPVAAGLNPSALPILWGQHLCHSSLFRTRLSRPVSGRNPTGLASVRIP
jgi:hypothetical protein